MAATRCNHPALIDAPTHWNSIDFISDLHLQVNQTEIFEAWYRFLQWPITERANALFILGDLFEVWLGDEVLRTRRSASSYLDNAETEFLRMCASALRQYSRHTPVFFMHGNRDFLLGRHALNACGMKALNDPTLLIFANHRFLLSHGDALCVNDKPYMQFREMVRSSAWQQTFLSHPIAQRKTIASGFRQQSQRKKIETINSESDSWRDVDHTAALTWLEHSNAQTLIHGHTHRPALHQLSSDKQRIVLSDWDWSTNPPKAEILRMSAHGVRRITLIP